MTRQTVSIRVKINESNINVIKHHPWFGVGYGKVPEAFYKYVANLEHRMTIRTSRLGLARPNNPHNWHLQVLGEEGLVGGALYYGAILGFIIYMFRLRRRLPERGAFGADLVTTIIVSTAANLIVLNFYGGPKIPYPVWTFWMVFGLMVRLGELTAQEQEQPVTANVLLQHRAEPVAVA
jgi:O-antigen ligase